MGTLVAQRPGPVPGGEILLSISVARAWDQGVGPGRGEEELLLPGHPALHSLPTDRSGRAVGPSPRRARRAVMVRCRRSGHECQEQRPRRADPDDQPGCALVLTGPDDLRALFRPAYPSGLAGAVGDLLRSGRAPGLVRACWHPAHKDLACGVWRRYCGRGTRASTSGSTHWCRATRTLKEGDFPSAPGQARGCMI